MPEQKNKHFDRPGGYSTPLPSVNVSDPASVIDVFNQATSHLLAMSTGSTHLLPSEGTVVISGDLHDNPFHLAKIIKLASLEDESNHVVLQELIHGATQQGEHDLSYRMLLRVAALINHYPTQVHPLLANHELSQLTQREITKGGVEMVCRFIEGVKHVFANKTAKVLDAIDDFFKAMPLVARSESGLFCSHSLPNEAVMDVFDTGVIDRRLKKTDMKCDGSAYFMVWGRQHTQAQLDQFAKIWNVNLFCLGHAYVPGGICANFNNMVQLNSDHQGGVALQLDLSSVRDAIQAVGLSVKLQSLRMEPSEL